MFKRIDHVELVPVDLQTTLDFYTNVLGFELKSRHPVNMPPVKEVVYITLGDTMMELIDVFDSSAEPISIQTVGYWAIALEVESMDKATEYLKGKGISLAWGPVDLGNSIRAEIRDPNGLTIELREWKR